MALSLKYILRDFADWTSMPGLIQLINALNAYIRGAWAIIWLAMWGVFLYEFYLIVDKFLGYPASVTISLGYKGRAFPMVTICNLNPMRYQIIQKNSTYSDVNDIVSTYKTLVQNNYGNLTDNPYGLNDYDGRFTKTQVIQQALLLAMNSLTDDQRIAAGYTLDNFILAWYFNNAQVNSSFFNQFLDPTYGLCYQFNSNKSGITLSTNRAGSYFGLRALALVNQRSPDGTLQYLPTTSSAGLKVGINYQNEDPAMENYGINVGVGTETMISLELTEVNRASSPYGDCTDDEELNYYTSFNYTLTYCFRSCIQKRNIDACGCANPVYAKPDNASSCTLSNLQCVFGQKTSQAAGSNFSVASECGCDPSCSDTNFDVILSVGKSPSLDYAPLVDKNNRYSCSVNSTLFANEAACLKWYETNSAVVNIWYDGLDYTLQAEGSSYSLSTASNDLGGQAGLWVGISLVSVIEGVVFIVFILLYMCFGRKHSDVEITDDIRGVDNRYLIMKGFKEELDTQEIMDEEIAVRYRAFKMRDELKRLAKLQEGERLNALAVAKDKQKKEPSLVQKMLS